MSTLHKQTIIAFGKLLRTRAQLFTAETLSGLETQLGKLPDDPVALANGLARWCEDWPDIRQALGTAASANRSAGAGVRSVWEEEEWEQGPREKLNTLIAIARPKVAPADPQEEDVFEPSTDPTRKP